MQTNHLASRRQWLRHSGCGFGMLALAGLLNDHCRAESAPGRAANPFSVLPPHFPPRAKRVIFLYMPGGPSHVDLLDPKPRLEVDNGKPLP
ncbi:MAG: hypothetical protein RL458_286, partial [Pseudomonadota bacterium]